MNRFAFLAILGSLGLLFSSCSTLRSILWDQDWMDPPSPSSSPDSAPDPGPASSFLDNLAVSDQYPGLAFALRSVKSVSEANQPLTPEQEYYVGRAFGAQILGGYKPYDNPTANRYVNQIGQAIAMFSDRAETWAGGYRFQILDSPEVNAFAAPGGLVFVTRGLIKQARNEDELAAVLAHEIAHIDLQHGIRAIQKNRQTAASLGVASDFAKTFGGDNVKALAANFEGTVTDLVQTVRTRGYARETEYEADSDALDLLVRAGYPPQALVAMLQSLKTLPKSGEGGFTKTHPTPDQRLAEVKKSLGRNANKSFQVSSAQRSRFQAALGGI